MLGFAFADINIAVMLQDYKLYVGEVVRDDSTTEIESIGKFLKQTANDPRRKVLWVNGLPALRRIQQQWPAEKVSDILIGVFDSSENLAKTPNVKIVDAELEVKTEADKSHHTWQMHQYDINAALQAAEPGYVMASKPVKPAKNPQDSLASIFDPMLEKIPEGKREKAASFIATRLEGVASKEEWTKYLERIEKYGLPADLVKAAIRTYRDAGHLKPLRAAVRAVVVDGVDLEVATQVAGARPVDLAWVNKHWPLENSSAEMLGDNT
jgi:hypothetical protein